MAALRRMATALPRLRWNRWHGAQRKTRRAIDVTPKRREPFGEFRIVLCLGQGKANVFKQQNIGGVISSCGFGCLQCFSASTTLRPNAAFDAGSTTRRLSLARSLRRLPLGGQMCEQNGRAALGPEYLAQGGPRSVWNAGVVPVTLLFFSTGTLAYPRASKKPACRRRSDVVPMLFQPILSLGVDPQFRRVLPLNCRQGQMGNPLGNWRLHAPR